MTATARRNVTRVTSLSGRRRARSRDAAGTSQPLAATFPTSADVIRQLHPELPVLCFCEPALRRQVNTFKQGFPGELTYAVKANSSDQIIALLVAWGVRGFDVASLPEMELVLRHKPDAALYYNNPIKSREEIRAAYFDVGVRHFTIDDMAELDKIIDVIGTPGDVTLAVRFMIPKTTALFDFYTKFGAAHGDAVELARRASQAGFKVTLSFHPGSQCTDPGAYANHIELAAQIAREAGIRLESLNVGGGFPIDYPGANAPGLDAFFAAIDNAMQVNFGAERPRLVCEPGRALVAPAMSLITRVRHKRATGTLFLNDGIYGALMEISLVPIDFPARVFTSEGTAREGELVPTKVFGPTCDSVDKLPRPIPLPDTIEEGDWVEFGAAGAYSLATVTSFNGFGRISQVNVDEILEP